MSTEDDRALLVRAAEDVDAFEAFYRRHVGQVTAYATTRCKCAADVADVVAQTFMRLLLAARTYDPERGEPIGFLLSIARSTVGDHYRGTARRRRLAQRLAQRLVGSDLLTPDESEQIEAAIDAARSAGPVRDALQDMPSAEGEVLELVAEGASPSEAAAALGIPAGTARVRLHRGRRRIRSQLSPQPTEEM